MGLKRFAECTTFCGKPIKEEHPWKFNLHFNAFSVFEFKYRKDLNSAKCNRLKYSKVILSIKPRFARESLTRNVRVLLQIKENEYSYPYNTLS